ncbi:DUF2867 domain-containing protein [Jatrophihabitans fulvus]
MSVTTTHHLSARSYADAHVLTLERPTGHPAVHWMREVIERSMPLYRLALPPGWRVLGLRLGRTHAPDNVHGWPIVHDGEDEVLLGARSRWGFDARLGLSLERDRTAVRFTTALTFDTRAARALWVPVAPGHRVTVASMLRQAAVRLG